MCEFLEKDNWLLEYRYPSSDRGDRTIQPAHDSIVRNEAQLSFRN